MYAQLDYLELLDFGPDATFSKHNGLEELEHGQSFCSLPERQSQVLEYILLCLIRTLAAGQTLVLRCAPSLQGWTHCLVQIGVAAFSGKVAAWLQWEKAIM